MKRYLTLCLWFIIASHLYAQSPKGKSLGEFVSMQKTGNQLSIKTTHGQVSIQVFSPTIIKISIAEKNL